MDLSAINPVLLIASLMVAATPILLAGLRTVIGSAVLIAFGFARGERQSTGIGARVARSEAVEVPSKFGSRE